MPVSCEGTTIHVPGKIVLAGEYAVLDGCPALVLAIERGVGCTISKGAGIHTPNGDTRFVAPLLNKLARTKCYTFFDWNPVHSLGAQKPGFGGSAAACVAACVAAGRDLDEAFSIHHRVQGSGSGVDVASSIHGGLIRYTKESIEALPIVSPVVIWSGNSATTGPRVQRYLAWDNRDAFVEESKKLVHHFCEQPIETTRALYRLLCSMAAQSFVEYQTQNIKKIITRVEHYGGGAKPSGAGGGDCVIAFFPSPQAQQSFQEECPFPIIEARPCTGIQIQTNQGKSS